MHTFATQSRVRVIVRGGTRGLLLAWTCLASLLAVARAEVPAAGKYPFPLPPLAILNKLPELKLGTPPVIGPEELKILQAAWNLSEMTAAGKPTPADHSLVVDAMLTASGVVTDQDRAAYRAKLDQLITDARAATSAGKTPAEQGELLMQFLHAGAMKHGYEEHQSSLAAVFDTGKFNCVSSSAVYYVVGTALGLELRIISIPGGLFVSGHAALDMLDGDRRIQLEPTNPNGFDWDTKLKQPGVYTVGIQPDRKSGHEVDGLGLAASIYSNRCVEAQRATPADWLAAASCGLRAMMLSPRSESAARNVVAVFANWGPELAEAGKFDEALRTLQLGTLATGNGDVRHNLHVVSIDNIEHLLNQEAYAQAQAAIAAAAADFPNDSDFQNARPWIRHADKRIDSHGWEAGLKVVDRALASLPNTERAAMLGWRSSLFRRWSQDLLRKEDAAGSLAVLRRAYGLKADDAEIHGGIHYHVQEALWFLDKESQHPEAAVAHFRDVLQAFPKLTNLYDRSRAHAFRSVDRLSEKEKFTDALAAAAVYGPLLDSTAKAEHLRARVWSDWSRYYANQQQWVPALDKCAEGLKTVRDDDLLGSGLRTIDDWADVAMSAGNWDEAIAVYDRGLTYFENNAHLKHNRDYCIAKRDEKK